MFRRILIANRGEIACRIARTCRRLGIAPVGVHSCADRDALHPSVMDASIGLGGASAADSYLRIDAVIDAARRTGAQAIHPGYGFLAENPAFAEAVESAGLVFIGPTADTLRRLGHKGQAKAEARAAGVPVLGGGEDASADAETVAERARSVTLPVLLKPAAGGGGKGMHVVRQASELHAAIGTAMREARSAFGDAALIVEPYVERGRHVEVQIAGDGRGEVIHLFERECTLQRRHQKLIEEAPAAPLPSGLREELLDDALRIARRLDYRGVGTVEFLVAGDRHWFLEVNPRLQVEHPVTEEVTGVDIVELMLRVAAGEGLSVRQADVRVRGHAVEARLCAEDAERDFLPATGSIEQIAFPGGGVRVESGVRAGSEVTSHYDSLLAKLVAHAATRDEALDRVQAALAQTRVLGVTTNADFLRRLLARAEVRDASFHTRSIDEWLARPDRTAQVVPPAIVAAAGLWWMLDERARAPDCGAWSAADATGWQMHAGDDPVSAVPAVLLRDGTTVHEVHLGIPGPDGFTTVQVGDTRLRLALRAQPGGGWQGEQGGEVQTLAFARRGTNLFVQAGGAGHQIDVQPYLARAAAGSAGSGELRTPMMGTILATHAEVGQALRAGDVVVTMESMKMEMKICAERDGVLASLSAVAGQTVERGRVVAVVVAAADAPDPAPADAAT
ncbi:carbamoyl-phosphate synthase subunit L [Variovorax paradoxus]|uniref:acetyl/propionyl/methylcrotonyl-CoA carboxylase subunit alpha n=1 Tax=Comamonadaceae TaxID=80864 RepID=UPI00069227C0|nr:biotin carboxylase N-terminal domain-containing protein [Xenophilus azovorans]KPU99521.1 carbamoyl-phosphate synthase subunit L [Variovorax paradoxus]VTY39567.1 Acetyl-/propionyl-coenzyme A carboxylase alpha chain [Xylophilus ampelinus]KPV07544.1 carbamoyl-phosphate synthase subunit L [Variovorax paradoxus]KPV07793.1 carbamoyl-phosphate synthase subunit L [Variovorax paradoxus]KPV14750.1 carbamoyl-phosphate synthase subunit L [Variovorax paradoxus]